MSEKLLEEINNKLEILILIIMLKDKDDDEQIRILKNYEGKLSKREIEKVTGISRKRF